MSIRDRRNDEATKTEEHPLDKERLYLDIYGRCPNYDGKGI